VGPACQRLSAGRGHAREDGPAGRGWARPKKPEAGRRGKKWAAAAGQALGCGIMRPEEENFLSLFLFQIFQIQFSKDFQNQIEI
jgi:hypothetical protein